jgi:hypothetical protein
MAIYSSAGFSDTTDKDASGIIMYTTQQNTTQRPSTSAKLQITRRQIHRSSLCQLHIHTKYTSKQSLKQTRAMATKARDTVRYPVGLTGEAS